VSAVVGVVVVAAEEGLVGLGRLELVVAEKSSDYPERTCVVDRVKRDCSGFVIAVSTVPGRKD